MDSASHCAVSHSAAMVGQFANCPWAEDEKDEERYQPRTVLHGWSSVQSVRHGIGLGGAEEDNNEISSSDT